MSITFQLNLIFWRLIQIGKISKTIAKFGQMKEKLLRNVYKLKLIVWSSDQLTWNKLKLTYLNLLILGKYLKKANHINLSKNKSDQIRLQELK